MRERLTLIGEVGIVGATVRRDHSGVFFLYYSVSRVVRIVYGRVRACQGDYVPILVVGVGISYNRSRVVNLG